MKLSIHVLGDSNKSIQVSNPIGQATRDRLKPTSFFFHPRQLLIWNNQPIILPTIPVILFHISFITDGVSLEPCIDGDG